MKRFGILLSLCLLFSASLLAQVRSGPDVAKAPPTIAEKIAGMEKFPGYFPFYWDSKAGKVWLEIDRWNAEFLYVESLPAGIGSNDIGLDRGQLGQSYIVRFERAGPRVLLIASNYAYRANSDNADERRAVKDAFAESTLWLCSRGRGRQVIDGRNPTADCVFLNHAIGLHAVENLNNLFHRIVFGIRFCSLMLDRTIRLLSRVSIAREVSLHAKTNTS
jgi:hypothetical protein